ncbi:transglutaminase-like domain-containing protein [Patescibacteria group bacterium]|nr:transglutaminase-like domain-containing protein [Patescibacteria group bacterium]MBU1016194.1 transglutaminase-like domain-containing protein [Patescibacteria group bacterium]MBU1684689.1 transglutaminase-like domain-containing protein [Patescibacteria group bacterium]MBU1938940.1 transglutaminase-like domain-containing protein [Patescibacteria group bacterium]
MTHKAHDIEEEFHSRKSSSFHALIALITAISLFFLSIQAYFYLIHPEPVNIPGLEEVGGILGTSLSQPFSAHRSGEVKRVIEEVRNDIKQVANFIAAKSCRKADRVCQSKAIFYFVRDEIRYVPDANFHDRLENPLTVLKTGGADCEDMAVLLVALEQAIGNKVRLVFVPGHAYVQVSIPDYRGEKWLNLEATCKDCQFGELPNNVAIQKKDYTEIQ